MDLQPRYCEEVANVPAPGYASIVLAAHIHDNFPRFLELFRLYREVDAEAFSGETELMGVASNRDPIRGFVKFIRLPHVEMMETETGMRITESKLLRIVKEMLAFDDPDLENYRRAAIKSVKSASRHLKVVAADVLGLSSSEITVHLIGSILDPKRFRDDSDIDVAFLAAGAGGLDEEASEAVQREMLRHPIDSIGIVNTLVFRGTTMKDFVAKSRELV